MVRGRVATRHEEFDQIFNLHHAYVYHMVYGLLGHAQDAEDVTQEVFVRVYKALPAYQAERASLRTWLARIVLNACHTHRRRNLLRRLWQRNADPSTTEEDAGPTDLTRWGMPEDQALQTELRYTIKRALDRLQPEYRTVLVLHYYSELSCPEIAHILDCPEGTVYSRLHRGRRLLRAELAPRA
ncbi:MAG: RNA polymerase sigma factor [Chloroflexia bacterium]